MTQTFKSYWILLKTCLKENYSLFSRKKKEAGDSLNAPDVKSKASKAFGAIGIAASCVLLLVTLVIMVASFTYGVIQINMQKELLSVVLFAVQVLMLFLGGVTTLSYLYFGKDNQLLNSLPIKSGVIFAVKFTLAYISELIISALFTLPILLTFGITSAILGYSMGAGFYIITILSVFLLPILPLLIISLLSIPLMYIVSFLKRRNVAKVIVSIVMALVFIGIYFLFMMMSMNIGGEETDEISGVVLNENMQRLLSGGAKAGILNICLVRALVGENAFVNFLIFFAGLIAIFALTVFLSSIFYRRGVSVLMEEGTSSPSAKKKGKAKEDVTVARSFRKSYFLKDLKTILGTPQILSGMIIGIIFSPLLVVFLSMGFGNSIVPDESETFTIVNELYLVGLACYIVVVMGGSTNAFALSAFSFEQKNFAVLKTMPITPKDVVLSKLLISNASIVLMSLFASIAYIATSQFHNVLIGFLMLISLLVNGVATSSLSLYYDLKNPKFNFNNVSELTKNNKKALKPTFINLGVGLIYFILGIVLSFVGLSPVAAYGVFFAVTLLVGGLQAFLCVKKLFDSADKRFEEIEV